MLKYEKGKIVKGCVTGIEKYGVFIGLDEFYSGLIHISEISNNFVKNVNDYVKIGETIRVKVIDTDEENYHVKLSIKDINYHINKNFCNNVNEVGKGFKPLKDNLETWVNDKLEIIKKK